MESIITQLKDDKEYYTGIGRNYLSNSDIGTLLSNPKDFGKPRGDSKHLVDGRYFHHLLLEPDKAEATPFVDVATRTTNAYKAFCEDNNMPYVMLKKEQDELQRLASIIKGNIEFYDSIYATGNKFEVPSIAEIHGVMFKGKTDIECEDFLIDIKTTSDINKFKWSAKSYNYDSQCYIYQTLFKKPLVFYVVDKETGQLGVFKPTDSFVMGGEAKVKRAIDVYNKFFSPTATESIDNYFINEILE